MGLRRIVCELMIYDADDRGIMGCEREAKKFLADHEYGAWTVAAAGIRGVGQLADTLRGYCNIQQLSFCTHGFPGGVYFRNGSLGIQNLQGVQVPPTLFSDTGRLLFMGCETARTDSGEQFLIAAGKHFFAGKPGVVGGTTIYNIGLIWGARLPVFGRSSGGWHTGQLVIYQLDAQGNVTQRRVVKPFSL